MSEFFTKNNVDIPSIGLGTWDLRGKEGENVIQVALDVGYRHIDTAQMYENEKEVGNAIINSKIEREKLLINLNQEINEKDLNNFNNLIDRRKRKEPIAVSHTLRNCSRMTWSPPYPKSDLLFPLSVCIIKHSRYPGRLTLVRCRPQSLQRR